MNKAIEGVKLQSYKVIKLKVVKLESCKVVKLKVKSCRVES